MPDVRLIDANALVDKVRTDWGLTCHSQMISATAKLAAADAMCKLLGEVAKLPTIDAVPVVHGRWGKSDIPHEKYCCSACGGACWYYDYEGEVARSRYCPNCGAKMDGGSE